MQIIKKYHWLLPSLLFTGILIITRIVKMGNPQFFSIEWNLFLAAVPLVLSYFLPAIKNKILGWALFALWLLFFPNAMYIITDLFHLCEGAPVPQWYDLLILFSAAVNGAIMGLLSLQNAEQFLKKVIAHKYIPVIIFSLFLLCGYGIYLGRYRWLNSWDILTKPGALFWGLAMNVRHPHQYAQVWMITGLFGTWLYIIYAYFKRFKLTA
jgi:uncharacterized membrane protein